MNNSFQSDTSTQTDDQGYYDDQDYWEFLINEYEPEADEYDLQITEYSEQ